MVVGSHAVRLGCYGQAVLPQCHSAGSGRGARVSNWLWGVSGGFEFLDAKVALEKVPRTQFGLHDQVTLARHEKLDNRAGRNGHGCHTGHDLEALVWQDERLGETRQNAIL